MSVLPPWGPRSLAALVTINSLFPHGADDEIRCKYTRREVCSEGACRAVPVGSAYLLSPSLKVLKSAAVEGLDEQFPELTLRRCDDRGCTPVTVIARHDGAFLDVTAPPNAYMIKFVAMNSDAFGLRAGDFVEVATIYLTVEISYGHCPVGPGD